MEEKLREIIKYHIEAYGGKINPKDDFNGFIFDILNLFPEPSVEEIEKILKDWNITEELGFRHKLALALSKLRIKNVRAETWLGESKDEPWKPHPENGGVCECKEPMRFTEAQLDEVLPKEKIGLENEKMGQWAREGFNQCIDACKQALLKMGGSMLKPTGWCWRCGRVCEGLFCPKPKKCEDIYYRNQERQILKGKRAGYGLAGSCR